MANVGEGEGSQNESSSSSGKTILRVKRKRSEDPADILLVSHAFKKPFSGEHQVHYEANNSVQRVFRLAGTVSQSKKNVLTQEVLTVLKYDNDYKAKTKANFKNDVSVKSISEKLRNSKKLASQRSRYKVISENRKHEEETRQLQETISSEEEEILNLYKLYDVVLDESDPSWKAQVKDDTPEPNEDPNSILCNSVKMIREKLKIDSGPAKSLDILEKDFVFDVYCAEDSYGALSEVLDIIRLNQSELVPEVEDLEDQYDDEDDSNDENNWRNDYPDEDEWNQSSDEESRYKSENFDYGWADRSEEDCGARMFSENLSSDDDQDYAYFGKRYDDYGKKEDEYNYEIVDEDD